MHMSVMHSFIRGFIIFFLRSAKGAAHTTKQARNRFAPHSVFREFLRRSVRCHALKGIDPATLLSLGTATSSRGATRAGDYAAGIFVLGDAR